MAYSAVVRRWIGLVSSMLCTILSGLFLAFNVYAVQLRQRLDLSQTQVEILASFTIAGLCVAFIGYFIITQCGYRFCYMVSWTMVTSSALLMWLATVYSKFFHDWIAFLCLFQFMSTIGGCLSEQCCVAIAVTLFKKRQVGKVTGLYLAGVSVGKIYYAALYQIFFKTEEYLGEFFLSVPVGFTLTVVPCIIFHRPSESSIEDDDSDEEKASLKTQDDKSYTSDNNNAVLKDTGNVTSLSSIMTSGYFHLLLWSNALFNSCNASFMNNVTAMAHDIGITDSEVTVYAISVGIILSRFLFGAAFDFFGSQKAGYWLLFICYSTFMAAMIIGWLWLTNVSIFVIIGISSIGIGAAFSLGLAILSTEYGLHFYSFLIGMVELGITVFSFLIQILIGLTHDFKSNGNQMRCHQCFDWTFVILFSCSAVSIVCLLVVMFVPKRQSSEVQ